MQLLYFEEARINGGYIGGIILQKILFLFSQQHKKKHCVFVIREKDANIRLVIELYSVLHIKEYLRCCRKDHYLRHVVGYGKIFEIAHYFYQSLCSNIIIIMQ